MAIYNGVVTLADNDIPVVVELDDHHVRMSASGTEIGDWTADECSIAHVADTLFTITAEDETLQFVPSQPSLFAAAVNGTGAATVPMPPEPRPEPVQADDAGDAPAPKPLTMGLFYALCLVTAALAIWSLISIAF